MDEMLLTAAALAAAAFNGYTMAFQSATLYWGKWLSPNNDLLPTGMQDAITPPAQSTRVFASLALLLAVAVAGGFVFRWWAAPIILFASFFGSGIMKMLFPNPDSDFFRRKILNSLSQRESTYRKEGDYLRSEVAQDLLAKLRTA